ncbi:MAG: hypothetical protein HY360_25110 [Verrucomicrobia bacterium]|nr:hypothetical protein [Verrucomicrobiota bacterium]
MSNATVHHHIQWLLAREAVALHATRPGPNGITEKLYKVNRGVWDPVKNAMGKEERGCWMLDLTLDGIHECHRVGVQLIKADRSSRFIAGSFGVFAKPREIHQLKRKVHALLEDFRARHTARKPAGGSPVNLTFAILPSTANHLQGVKILDMMQSRKELEKISGRKISDMKLAPRALGKVLALDR